MIEQKQSGAVILQDGEDIQETIKMSLDLDSAKNLMQILSKNLYSDPIGSSIREISSNALDSHRAANVTDRPIIVTFDRTSSGNYEFTVEDFGSGLDHDEVINIISKYGKSTKQLSDTQLGMFGLGWKSPLAYTSSFTFITRKDGIERKYIMSEGEEENIIDLIDENSTSESNGVKVIVPVNSYDVNDFYKKIKEQLCYFESIYFNVNANGKTIDNAFKITRYDDFQLSEINNDNNLHLCLDNVYYPLDFKKLGIDVINVPVGLRFSLSDGIYPTPNREQLRYTTEAKAIILDKIKTVSSKIVEMYNKSVENTDDFKQLINYYSNSKRYLDIGHVNNIEITNLLGYSSVQLQKPNLNGVSLLDIKRVVESKSELISEYSIIYLLRYGKLRENKHNETLEFYHIDNGDSVYRFADRIGGNKKEYLKSIIGGSKEVYFVKKKRIRKLFPEKRSGSFYEPECESYYKLLHLKNYPKDQWRTIIKEFQSIQNIYIGKFIDTDAIDIPKAWLDARKAQRVSVKIKKNGHQKLEGEVSCKKAERLERYVDGKNCKFTPFSIDLAKLQQTNLFYIYTGHEDSLKLDKLFEPFAKQNIKLITFSERELKKVNELDVHNLISYDKFMKGETIVFKRLVTSHLIYTLERKNRNVFDRSKDVANISTDLSIKLMKLEGYMDKYYHTGDNTLYEAMIEIANKYSLFDHSIYGIYKEIKETLDKFPFINALYREFSNYGEQIEQRDNILTDLLKYHKYKLNLDKYAKKVEAIEELTETINN